MQINKSFYHDFEVAYFKALKRIMAPFKNQKHIELVLAKPCSGNYDIRTILNDIIKMIIKSDSMYSDSNISVAHIETGLSPITDIYSVEEIGKLTEPVSGPFFIEKIDGIIVRYSSDVIDPVHPENLKYKKYAIVDKSTDDDILIITFIFSNGYYLGFNMKRKVTKWEELTTENINK